jgi:uncharacterized membrane protein
MRFIRHCVIGAMFGVSVAAQAAGYSLVNLTPAGASSADAWDVNNVGQVVGSYGGSGFTYSRGYVWSGGVFTTLSGPTGALSLNALGVSDTGAVVGSYYDSTIVDDTGAVVLGNASGFIFEGGSYTTVNAPGALATNLRGISPNGRYVTGYAQWTANLWQGFVLDRGTSAWTVIGSSNENSLTIVQGVNSFGQVVGDERLSGAGGSLTRTSFIYDITTGIRTDQNLPGATRTSYRDINDAGQIAGFAQFGTLVGFVGTPASFQTLSYGPQNDTILEGINNAGWLVGRYVVDADGNSQAMLLTPVPEPSVWLLTLAGFGVVGWQVRRRRT